MIILNNSAEALLVNPVAVKVPKTFLHDLPACVLACNVLHLFGTDPDLNYRVGVEVLNV